MTALVKKTGRRFFHWFKSRRIMKKEEYSGKGIRIWAPLCLLSVGLLSGAVAKPNFPYHFHSEQNIDEHQVGYLDVTVNADGSGVVHTKFSNGQQIRGNTFSSATGFYGTDGKPFLVVVQTKGLDGSMGGRAREGDVEQPVQLTPEQLEQFDQVKLMGMRAMCDGVDLKCMSVSKIKEWLGPAIEIAKVIYEGWSP